MMKYTPPLPQHKGFSLPAQGPLNNGRAVPPPKFISQAGRPQSAKVSRVFRPPSCSLNTQHFGVSPCNEAEG